MFKKSLQNLKTTKGLCMAAVFAALFVVLYAFKLPLTNELRISFTFIPIAAAGWLLGPVPAMAVGFAGDISGALLFPQGAYFPGFTLTSVLSGMIFGIFLYGKEARTLAAFTVLAKFTVSVLLNCALNALWLSIITGNGYFVYLIQHFTKNIVLLPLEVIMLLLIFKILSAHNVKKMYK